MEERTVIELQSPFGGERPELTLIINFLEQINFLIPEGQL